MSTTTFNVKMKNCVEEYDKNGIICFTFPGINATLNKDGKIKKETPAFPKWKNINQINYKNFIVTDKRHKGLAVITGEMSGITGLDFDDPVLYENTMNEFPEMKSFYTVKTNKGFHIYCKYDKRVGQTTNIIKGLDIRNDGGILYAPPTIYRLPDGGVVSYQYIGGDILPIPEELLKRLIPKISGDIVPIPKTEHVDDSTTDGDVSVLTIATTNETTDNKVNLHELNKVKAIIEEGLLDEEAGNYTEWFKIACIFKNEFGEIEGYDLFKTFSKRCEGKYDEAANKTIWDKNISNKSVKSIKLGSLYRNIKNKKPEFSLRSIKTEVNEAVTDAITKKSGFAKNEELLYKVDKRLWDFTDAGFAKELYKTNFTDEVLFTGNGDKLEGYLYNGIYWKGLPLHNAELHGYFDKLYLHYYQLLQDNKQFLDERNYVYIKHSIQKVQAYVHRNNILKVFKTDRYKPDIEWNKYKDLFVFEDCIYDLSKGEFVTPNPEQYLNSSSGYKYDMGFSPEAIFDAKTTILKFFQEITGGERERDFLLKTFSRGLKQENTDEKAYFHTGSGRNGKGTGAVLVNNSFGNYCGILNVEYYTTPKKSVDEPNQNLYNCRNSRLLYTSEANDVNESNIPVKFLHDKFQSITGRDYIQARALGKPDTAKFQAGIVIIALNFMVNFSNKNEDCVRERVIIQDFPFTFTSDQTKIDSDPIKYKLGNSKLKSLFEKEEYRRAMIDLLFEYYQKVEFIPDTVKSKTQSYFRGDSLKGWILENYESGIEGNRIPLEDVQEGFKRDTDRKLSIKKIKEDLEKDGFIVTKVKGYYFLKGFKVIPEEA